MKNPTRTISRIIEILQKNAEELKDPSVTMVARQFQDPFLVLISCLLSLRTKDAVTLKASERLFRIGKTPQTITRIPVSKIERAIYPVGFYRTKARTIRTLCRDLVKNFHGRVPDDIETLLTFKGVGRKTANLVLTEGFGKPGMCVDTHVHRISNRLGFVQTANPLETEMALRKKLPQRFWIEYNALLVMWGQNVCKPVSPLCSRCAVFKWCDRKKVSVSR